MRGPVEEVEHGRLLDLAAGIHDEHALAGLGHHAEVVSDENDGGAGLLLQLEHQLQHLRLYRDVERGCRLVRDQHLGIAGERHGNHHPLPHASRELVGIVVEATAGVGDLDEVQHLYRARAGGRRAGSPMNAHGFRDLVADGQHRIEARHRLLEDHGDAIAPDVAHLPVAQAQEVSPRKSDAAADDAADARRQEAEDRKGGDALAAARLPDDPERLSRIQRERQAVDGARHAVLVEEVSLEVGYLEERLGHRAFSHMRRAMRGSSRSRSPSPTRLTASTTSASAMPGQNTVQGARPR